MTSMSRSTTITTSPRPHSGRTGKEFSGPRGGWSGTAPTGARPRSGGESCARPRVGNRPTRPAGGREHGPAPGGGGLPGSPSPPIGVVLEAYAGHLGRQAPSLTRYITAAHIADHLAQADPERLG